MDDQGRLLRCYTQNIDGLEARAGLETGIPPPRRSASRKPKRQTDSLTADSQPPSRDESGATTPASSALGDDGPPSHPPAPRCIPLHGLLSTLHCTLCRASVPITKHLPLPGEPIACPDCDFHSTLRSALSERARKVGTLRASVVLYGEEHPEGDLIGSVMERDLRGTGRRGEREGRADLLLVAGTSLSIPGVKRIVKEMAKSLATRSEASVRDGREPPIRAVFINAEAPAKPAEWEGVFDVWAQGDVQVLAQLVGDESFAPPLPPKTPRRKAKDAKDAKEGAKASASKAAAMYPTPESSSSGTPRKRKAARDDETPTKKRGFVPLTPEPTPPRRDAGDAGDSSRLPSPSPQPRFSRTPSPPPPLRMDARRGVCSSPPPRSRSRVEESARLPKMFAGAGTALGQRNAGEAAARQEKGVAMRAVARARFSPPPPYDDLAGMSGRRVERERIDGA